MSRREAEEAEIIGIEGGRRCIVQCDHHSPKQMSLGDGHTKDLHWVVAERPKRTFPSLGDGRQRESPDQTEEIAVSVNRRNLRIRLFCLVRPRKSPVPWKENNPFRVMLGRAALTRHPS